MEGDPFFEPAGGLEFLFGVLWREADGSTSTSAFRAPDRDGESAALRAVRRPRHASGRKAFPDMHVYHYAAYEPSTLARLMGTHATREAEIDELLRGEVLVDLFQVVRQSLRAGVRVLLAEGDREALLHADCRRRSGNEAVVEFERWLDDGDPSALDGDRGLQRRGLPRDARASRLALEQRGEAEPSSTASRSRSGRRLSHVQAHEDPESSTRRHGSAMRCSPRAAEGDGRELAARLLEYHRREARPAWWWYLPPLLNDRRRASRRRRGARGPASGTARNPSGRSGRSSGHSGFPPQQHHFDEDDGGDDPHEDGTGWTVSAIDNATGTIALRRGKTKRDARLPTALVPGGPYPHGRTAGRAPPLGASMLAEDGRYPHLDGSSGAICRLGGSALQRSELDEQRALLDQLENTYLVVQGPPGSGKTYRGARLITHSPAQRKKVGIVAQSHKVIHNLLDEVEAAASEEGLEFKGMKKGDRLRSEHVKQGDVAECLDPEVTLVAGTAWLLAREELDGSLDTLVVDEAGQYSLADALAWGHQRVVSCCWATRFSLPKSRRACTRSEPARRVLEHLLAITTRSRRSAASFSTGRDGCIPTSAGSYRTPSMRDA